MPFGDEPERRREITAQELGALLSGIDRSQAKGRKRYRRKGTEALSTLAPDAFYAWPAREFAL
jgi:hypothetical protein